MEGSSKALGYSAMLNKCFCLWALSRSHFSALYTERFFLSLPKICMFSCWIFS